MRVRQSSLNNTFKLIRRMLLLWRCMLSAFCLSKGLPASLLPSSCLLLFRLIMNVFACLLCLYASLDTLSLALGMTRLLRRRSKASSSHPTWGAAITHSPAACARYIISVSVSIICLALSPSPLHLSVSFSVCPCLCLSFSVIYLFHSTTLPPCLSASVSVCCFDMCVSLNFSFCLSVLFSSPFLCPFLSTLSLFMM